MWLSMNVKLVNGTNMVYEVITYTCYDFNQNIETKLFYNEEKARNYYRSEVESLKASAEEDEWVIEEGVDTFESYEDGYAAHNEASVRICTKEIE